MDPRIEGHRRGLSPVRLPSGRSGLVICKFELQERYPPQSESSEENEGASALLGVWDPDENDGFGGYRMTTDQWTVRDFAGLGFLGRSGDTGLAVLRPRAMEPGFVGDIIGVGALLIYGFVLTETLEEGEWSTGAGAYIRYWDPAGDGGKGDFVTSEDEWRVYDRRRVGYYGESGTYGAAVVRRCDNDPGFCGVICDLHCPAE